MIRFGKSIALLAILAIASAIADEADVAAPVVQADGLKAEAAKAQLSLDDLRTFTDVFSQVRLNFIGESDDHTLINAAIRGMLSELDPHSAYMEPDEYRKMTDNSRGHYSGIGVEVVIRDRKINVVSVAEGGAAKKAGVQAGDIITSIGGTAVRGKNLQAAIDKLRGEEGSEIKVTFRHQDGEVSSHTLVRDFVKVASVFSRPVDGHYGYFQITHFTLNSADELIKQIRYLQDNHDAPLKGIILDIRGNPGGVLTPAVAIADGFLDDGLIVTTRGRSSNQMQYTAKPGQWLKDMPVVVLVNGGSASASEVLAGALQDHGRALIVGQTTFGKGSVQSVLNLRNGGGMRLTTSRYYTPSGRSIQAIGIRPDIEVPPVKILKDKGSRHREVDLDGHLDGEAEDSAIQFGSEVSAEQDYAMYQALMLLKANAVLTGSAALH